MAASEIMLLDEDGTFHELASYSLEPKAALIAYYMQNEKKNFNTWDYPKELDCLHERSFNRGFQYFKGDQVIYSRPAEEDITYVQNSVS